MSKQTEYKKLVELRTACRKCEGLSNPGCRALRKYDSEHIGGWTQLHGDLNAKLMIVGQDWGDVRYYLKHKGKDKPDNPTMQNLELLLRHIGLNISVTTSSEKNEGLFLTNAILCLKEGGLQATVKRDWFVNCQSRFLKPQIEIVQPKIVVALGERAYHAILEAFGLEKIRLKDAIMDSDGNAILKNTRLFAAYHCGRGTINRNRSLVRQKKDWERIGAALKISK